MAGGSGAAQELGAVQEWAERCQLCRCKVRWLQIKDLSEKGPMVGLVDCCCGKEQWGGSLIWPGGFGKSEDGSEMLHRTYCVCWVILVRHFQKTELELNLRYSADMGFQNHWWCAGLIGEEIRHFQLKSEGWVGEMAVSSKCCGGRRNVKEMLVHDSLNGVRKSSLSTGRSWDPVLKSLQLGLGFWFCVWVLFFIGITLFLQSRIWECCLNIVQSCNQTKN